MQPNVSGPAPSPLVDSARGWHNIQLGVMGFIGFCGVLKMGSEQPGPEWLSWGSAGMSILALVTSFFSTWMVGSVAFPTYGPEAAMPAEAPGRLKGGIVMTFISIAMMAIAGAAGWWPAAEGGAKVQVTDSRGGTACGSLVDNAPAGILWIKTEKGTVTVSLDALSDLTPVDKCA